MIGGPLRASSAIRYRLCDGQGTRGEVHLSAEQRQACERAAMRAGLSLSEWIRQTLDAARLGMPESEIAGLVGLHVGEWRRVILISASGETRLLRGIARVIPAIEG